MGTDTKSNDYLYNMEVVRCNCEDKKLYATICGKNGIVRQVTQIEPDQKSKIFNPVGTYFAISVIPLLGVLVILLSLNWVPLETSLQTCVIIGNSNNI